MPSDEYFEFSKGGFIPGSAGDDSIPVRVGRGEPVISARLVREHGGKWLQAWLRRNENDKLDYLFEQRD